MTKTMSLASDELDESQITAMDLPIEFKVNSILCPMRENYVGNLCRMVH